MTQVIDERAAERKAVGAANAVQFEGETKEVWAEPHLDRKRALVMKMVETFKYKNKQQYFREKVRLAPTGLQLDRLATQLMLYGEGLSVVRR